MNQSRGFEIAETVSIDYIEIAECAKLCRLFGFNEL